MAYRIYSNSTGTVKFSNKTHAWRWYKDNNKFFAGTLTKPKYCRR